MSSKDTQQILIDQRLFYFVMYNGQQVPFPEYNQDYLEGQRFADETMSNPLENQGYFLCLLRGQDCKIWK
jgi:hypothetical protein